MGTEDLKFEKSSFQSVVQSRLCCIVFTAQVLQLKRFSGGTNDLIAFSCIGRVLCASQSHSSNQRYTNRQRKYGVIVGF